MRLVRYIYWKQSYFRPELISELCSLFSCIGTHDFLPGGCNAVALLIITQSSSLEVQFNLVNALQVVVSVVLTSPALALDSGFHLKNYMCFFFLPVCAYFFHIRSKNLDQTNIQNSKFIIRGGRHTFNQ